MTVNQYKGGSSGGASNTQHGKGSGTVPATQEALFLKQIGNYLQSARKCVLGIEG